MEEVKQRIKYIRLDAHNQIQELWELRDGVWVKIRNHWKYWDSTEKRHIIYHYPLAMSSMPIWYNTDYSSVFTTNTQSAPGEKPSVREALKVWDLFYKHLEGINPKLVENELSIVLSYKPALLIKPIDKGWHDIFIHPDTPRTQIPA